MNGSPAENANNTNPPCKKKDEAELGFSVSPSEHDHEPIFSLDAKFSWRKIRLHFHSQKNMADKEKSFAVNVFEMVGITSFIALIITLFCFTFIENVLVADMPNMERFITPEAFSPEQPERASYIASLLSVPLSMLLGIYYIRRSELKNKAYILFSKIITAIVIAIFGYQFFIEGPLSMPLPLSLAIETDFFWMTGVLSFLFLFLSNKRVGFSLNFCLAIFISSIIFYASSGQYYLLNHHFDAFYYKIYSSLHAGSSGGQYGLYPIFFKVLNFIFDISAQRALLISAFLKGCCAMLSFLFIQKYTKNTLLTTVAILAFSCISYFYLFLHEDPYFQWYPLRALFPFTLLLISIYAVDSKKLWQLRGFIILGGVFSGVSFFWNPETGITCLVSWMAFSIHASWLYSRNFRFSVSTFLLTLLSTVVTLIATYYFCVIISNEDLDLYNMFLCSKIFYQYGFLMLKMPVFGYWIGVILLYFVALSYGTLDFFKSSKNEPRSSIYFFLGIFGLGLFAYYQGRSHVNCLMAAQWPALMIIIMLIFDIEKRLSVRKYLLSYGLVFSLFLWWVNLPYLQHLLVSLPQESAAMDVKLSEFKDLCKSVGITKNSKVQVLSRNCQGVLLDAIGTYPAPTQTPLAQIFYNEDVEAYKEKIQSCDFVILDYQQMGSTEKVLELLGNEQLALKKRKFDFVGKCQVACIVKRVPTGVLAEHQLPFTKSLVAYQDDSKVLPVFPQAEGNVFLHAKFDRSRLVAYNLGEQKLPTSFSLEVLVNVDPNQNTYGGIVGNHRAYPSSGLVIQQNGKANIFAFTYGTGNSWVSLPEFELSPNIWHYLVLAYKEGQSSLYLDGQLLLKGSKTDKPMVNSTDSIVVGDWIYRGRALVGAVKELRILNTPLSEQQINENWHSIEPSLGSIEDE